MSAAAAGATLSRAAHFWAERSSRPAATWLDYGGGGRVQARYLANGFRELDGFLRALLDEIEPAPPGPARRNTASKLDRMVLAGDVRLGGAAAADCARLRAIGRSAACLLHCGGVVRRPDLAAGRWMTAGWPEAGGDRLRRYPLGDRLRPGGDDVADVCGFFLRIARAIGG